MPYYRHQKLMSFVVPNRVARAIEEAAKIQDRSMSSYLKRVVYQDLRSRGLMTVDGEVLLPEGVEYEEEEGEDPEGDENEPSQE